MVVQVLVAQVVAVATMAAAAALGKVVAADLVTQLGLVLFTL
jgi:hypothetical protein